MGRREATLVLTTLVPLMVFGPAPWAMAGAQQGLALVADDTSARLPLAYFSSAELRPGVGEAARAEVARILDAAGVGIDELTADALQAGSRPTCGFLVRVVIRDQSPVSWGLPDHAMGVTFGRQSPPEAVFVFRTAVLRTLGVANKKDGYLSDTELGRAFGRVIVHELVHAFAPDYRHTGWGIMGHAQDAISLTQRDRTLDARTVEALLEAWQALAPLCD